MNPKELNRLSKFLAYMLGRHPDEFGLVPDSDGFVKLKEFLKAVNEESGWRHLRKSHINELCFSHTNPGVDVVDTMIRATDRSRLPEPHIASHYPKLLYICIRPKAYPVVLDKGISPRQGPWAILSSDKNLALRLGRRIDSSPILLTINTQQTMTAEVEILAFGEKLFLASHIPKECFTGPPVPKEKRDVKEKKQPAQPLSPPTPGSFYIELDQPKHDHRSKNNSKGKKQKGWKEARRKDNRRRKKEWP